MPTVLLTTSIPIVLLEMDYAEIKYRTQGRWCPLEHTANNAMLYQGPTVIGPTNKPDSGTLCLVPTIYLPSNYHNSIFTQQEKQNEQQCLQTSKAVILTLTCTTADLGCVTNYSKS